MNNRIKAVIFDVDGVLVDSRDFNVALITSLFEKAGYQKPDRQKILDCYHLSLWHTIQKLLKTESEREIKQLWDLVHGPDFEHPVHLFKFPKGLKQILERLSRRYRLAVATSRLRLGMEEILQASGIGHLFEEVVTYGDYKRTKPHPEPLILTTERMRIKPQEAVYVGDSPTDLQAAKAADMKSIYLSSPPRKDADISISSINELPKAVRALAGA